MDAKIQKMLSGVDYTEEATEEKLDEVVEDQDGDTEDIAEE